MKIPNWLSNILGTTQDLKIQSITPTAKKVIIAPGGRSSVPTAIIGSSTFPYMADDKKVVVNYNFLREIIPIIRSLSMTNPVMSQVIHDITSLANTGFRLHFDPSVPPEQADAMRAYIDLVSETWAPGQAGMHGLINKMFAQQLIAGAISSEWVPTQDLSGIKACRMVNPESIFFVYDIPSDSYKPFQRLDHVLMGMINQQDKNQMIPLNENTFRYFGLNGDTEVPYGFPPYLSSLEPLRIQGNMNKNMDFLVDIMGLLGFLEVLIDKPIDGFAENEEDAVSKLDTLLSTAKQRIMEGVKDGVVVGFKDDHEFNFHSLAKDAKGAADLYKLNDMQVASSVKTDPVLLGRDYNTSETQITVVFNKMIASLRNMQINVAANLKFGFTLALRLQGFNFKYVKVTFNRSTIQDDYKFQQAEEVKVRNVTWKYVLGMINQEQAAEELGYDSPAESKPLVAPELLIKGSVPTTDAGQNTKNKKDKGKSAKTQRDNNKPIPKNKDTKS